MLFHTEVYLRSAIVFVGASVLLLWLSIMLPGNWIRLNEVSTIGLETEDCISCSQMKCEWIRKQLFSDSAWMLRFIGWFQMAYVVYLLGLHIALHFMDKVSPIKMKIIWTLSVVLAETSLIAVFAAF